MDILNWEPTSGVRTEFEYPFANWALHVNATQSEEGKKQSNEIEIRIFYHYTYIYMYVYVSVNNSIQRWWKLSLFWNVWQGLHEASKWNEASSVATKRLRDCITATTYCLNADAVNVI